MRASDNPRDVVVNQLADAMTAIRVDHPTRVAIDGRSAAGKTTLADDIAVAVRERGRHAIRASIDDFYRPGDKFRAQRPDWTPQLRYDQGYDYSAFIELLLHPLGPCGTRRCRTQIFDSFHDVSLPEVWTEAERDSIAVIDGIFLLRPELAGHWDYIIWVDIDMETMVDRARRRDIAWMGSEQEVIDRYRRHWILTHELYERTVEPVGLAHAIIDNRNPNAPTIMKLERLSEMLPLDQSG